MRSTFAFALLALAGFSAAQEQYTIDPETVQESTREYWCQQQQTTCPQICLLLPGVTSMNTITNECDPEALTAQCVCENNASPNLTEYTQTLPFNICQQWGTNCVKDCPSGDNACADSCRADHPCGAQEPFKPNATSTSSSSSHSKTATASGSDTEETEASNTVPVTGFAGQTGTADQPGAASSLVNFGATYGMAVTFISALVGFALL